MCSQCEQQAQIVEFGSTNKSRTFYDGNIHYVGNGRNIFPKRTVKMRKNLQVMFSATSFVSLMVFFCIFLFVESFSNCGINTFKLSFAFEIKLCFASPFVFYCYNIEPLFNLEKIKTGTTRQLNAAYESLYLLFSIKSRH